MWLLIAFIAVPLIEIGLFIQVGGWIGLFPTLGIVLVTAVLGTWLVRTQGAMALGQLRKSFSDLNDPTEPLVHGAMILFAGALLLTPGFFTDAVGFALLVPAFRHVAYKALRARVNVQSFGTPGQGPHHAGPQANPHHGASGDIIDADFHEVDNSDTPDKGPPDNSPPDNGPSGWTKH